MDYQDKLHCRLTGDGPDVQRRKMLLTTVLAAFSRGGTEEATSALAQQLTALERAFEQQLADLYQLL
jgi:hypothetical protein